MNQELDNNSYARILGPERIARLEGPLGTARGLPGQAYNDSAVWDLERRTIFRKQWFAAAFASDIPDPGDFMPVSIAGWELLFVRGKDNVIRCFHNICRHRGTKLVHARGNGTQIRCGWHCWTYGLDGFLKGTPIVGGQRINSADGIDTSQLGLLPLDTGEWLDIIFVKIDQGGPSLDEHLKPLKERLAPYGLDKYRADAPADNGERMVDINWKLYHEGGLEGYHIPFVHPALEQPPGYQMDEGSDCFVSISADLGAYKRLGTADGTRPARFALNDLAQQAAAAGQRLPYTIAFTPPTIIVAPWPEMLILTLLRPESMTRTGVRRRMYFIGEAASDPNCEAARQQILDIWDGVTDQDAGYSAEVQNLSGLRDELNIDTRFSPHWEPAVRAFQQYVVRNTSER
jgi:choline monooxygenase